jgi:hypothetical protein
LAVRLLGSIVAVRWQDDESAIDRERIELDGKARTFLVREGGEAKRDVNPSTSAAGAVAGWLVGREKVGFPAEVIQDPYYYMANNPYLG